MDYNFEKYSLEVPAATGIGGGNARNIPGKYATPGAPAVTSRAVHDTPGRPLEFPTIDARATRASTLDARPGPGYLGF